MGSTTLERKYSSVERGGRGLRSITITIALGVVLLMVPITGTKHAGQKVRKDISQMECGLIKENGSIENMGSSGKMTAVCDGTYVYHGPHYLK